MAVIGAGIIGVTTGYELARDGHEVSVFERRGSVAAETSFANAGVIAPGYVTPWAAPGMPLKVLGHLLDRHAAVRLHPTLRPSTIAWLWRWWQACSQPVYLANRVRMQRLAYFSRQRLREITGELRLAYERSDGYLVLLRTEKDLAMVQPGLESLRLLGTAFKLLSAEQCQTVEPDISTETALHAGVHLPQDEVGNCREFAYLMRAQAQQLGTRFHFHTSVLSVVPGRMPEVVYLHGDPKDSIPSYAARRTPRDPARDTEPLEEGPVSEAFDAVVVCAGVASAPLLRTLGLRVPLLAVYGYSVTAPLRRVEGHPNHGPRSALMDEHFKVAISRIGTRVRVAGSAEIGGAPMRNHPGALATLHKVLHDWFPASAVLGQAQTWKGARPMLPDGPPLLGRSGVEGVWLNLGHGSSGWALACGSARLLADSLARRASAIDIEGLGIERLRGAT